MIILIALMILTSIATYAQKNDIHTAKSVKAYLAKGSDRVRQKKEKWYTRMNALMMIDIKRNKSVIKNIRCIYFRIDTANGYKHVDAKYTVNRKRPLRYRVTLKPVSKPTVPHQ